MFNTTNYKSVSCVLLAEYSETCNYKASIEEALL